MFGKEVQPKLKKINEIQSTDINVKDKDCKTTVASCWRAALRSYCSSLVCLSSHGCAAVTWFLSHFPLIYRLPLDHQTVLWHHLNLTLPNRMFIAAPTSVFICSDRLSCSALKCVSM